MVVHTNDVNNRLINLTVQGFVEKFATVNPERVFLNGPPDKNLSVKLEIIPEEKYPFRILETSALNGNNIRVKLENVQESESKRFVLTVRNATKIKGRYYDVIIVRTDSKIHPEIRIPVLGNII
jgi:hypothetical protein